MANEVTFAALTNLVNTEFIDPLIADYALDTPVIAQTARVRDLRGLNAKAVSFNKRTKANPGVASLSELGTASNSPFTTSEVSVTAGKIGILRHISVEALHTGDGAEALENDIIEDNGKLLGEKLDTDLAALFASATSSVSHTTLDMSVTFYLEGMGKWRANKGKGPVVGVWSDVAATDLQTSVATTTAQVFGNSNVPVQNMMDLGADGTLGPLFNIQNYWTNVTTTANAGADDVSAFYTHGFQNPKQAALAIVLWWTVETMFQNIADTVSVKLVSHWSVGTGLINTDSIVKFITGAT